MVSGRFLFEKFTSSVFRKKWSLFNLQIQYVRRFFNIYCYYNYTAEHAEDNTTNYLKWLSGSGINITDK